MAKNNIKGDFLKSGEVVCLPDKPQEDIGKKSLINNVVRRSRTTTTMSIEVAKVPKTVHMVPITYGVTSPTQGDNTPSTSEPVKIVSSTMSSCTPPVLRAPKQIVNRSTLQSVKRGNASPTKGRKIFISPATQKQEDASNGQVASSNTTGRRRSIPSGLTITPISAANAVVQSAKVMCKPPTFYQVSPVSQEKEVPARVTPKSTAIPKENFYSNKTTETAICYTPTTKCVVLAAAPMVTVLPRGRPRGVRNKVTEPVCLTISSDDEDAASDDAMESSQNGASMVTMSPQQAGIATPQKGLLNITQVNSNSSRLLAGQLVKAGPMAIEGREDEEDLDDEMVEEEEVEEEEEVGVHSEEMYPNEMLDNPTNTQILLKCRSIRIGSFKIHPLNDNPHILVYLNCEGFRFQIPTVRNLAEVVTINVKRGDIQQVLGHFGRCLPILFIFNTTSCGERIRKQLHMNPGEMLYFDPDGHDDRQKIITFLIDSLFDEPRNFLRNCFPGEGVLKEVDQKVANEILVKSTPQHNQMPSLTSNIVVRSPATFPASPVIIQNTLTPVVITTVPVKPAALQQNQVTKVLTYPPPPQTGGIAITSDDLLCLDEGEFLNDAIIDFYLKYLMNEKLSEKDRQRTHIFSSFFYPHLTNVSSSRSGIRLRSGEECSSSMSVKRHAQVRTWTKNVDIFEKDFIIIPINQKVHWFLAIICFPGLVPEAPLKNSSKVAESVTSTENDATSCPESTPMITQSPPAPVLTKNQACSSTDGDLSSDESLSSEVESTLQEEPLPDVPDSSTHPVRHTQHEKMPCILIFDSLSGPSRWRIVTTLREYLDMEWKVKKGTARDFSKLAMRGHVPNVPQQTNFSDCGLYVLQYVESFFESPFPYYSLYMPQMPNWFPPEKVASKREELKNLIFELQKRHTSPAVSSRRKDTEKILCTTIASSTHTNRLTAS